MLILVKLLLVSVLLNQMGSKYWNVQLMILNLQIS